MGPRGLNRAKVNAYGVLPWADLLVPLWGVAKLAQCQKRAAQDFFPYFNCRLFFDRGQRRNIEARQRGARSVAGANVPPGSSLARRVGVKLSAAFQIACHRVDLLNCFFRGS